MEIGIACANLPHAVLAHQDCSVRIVDQVSGKLRHLGDHLACDIGMA